MITETHIIEIRSSQSNDFTGTVTFAIPIRQVAKLKFRRQDSISLFFKENPDEPLIYECQDSADAVNQIQRVLRGQGVKGEKINSGVDAAVNKAVHLIQEIQAQQAALQHDPTVKRVNQILDMYQQAAEEFEKAGDSRHEAVVAHSQKFLALTETANILNGTYTNNKKTEENPSRAEPEGELISLRDTGSGDNYDLLN